MFADTLSVSGDDVCGFVCIVSSPLRKRRVRAQVYHGDEDGVAHITWRERRGRECIIVIREQLTVAHTTQLKAIMKLPSLAWSSTASLVLSFSLFLYVSPSSFAPCPLSPLHWALAPGMVFAG